MDDHKKTEDRTIAFPPGENGRLDLGGNATLLSGLLALGALAGTRFYDKDRMAQLFQTDQAGLEAIVELADDTVNGVQTLVSSIGYLIAHADHREIHPGVWQGIGWGLVGLSELARDASFLGAEAAYQANRQGGT